MLEMKNVTVSFDGRRILDHQSLIFPSHGMIGIKGESGCGKSTLLYVLSGLLVCDEGEVMIDGKRVDRTLLRRHIAFVKQNNDLLPELNAEENIKAGCVFSGTAYQKTTYERYMRQLGITKLAHRYPGELSGGQLKRVSIVRGLVKEADILLCDEPTGCLHRVVSEQVMSALSDVAKKRLVIVVSHDDLIDAYADEVLVLKDGVLSPSLHAEILEAYDVKHDKRYTYLPYAIREVLYQKNKLIALTLFQVLVLVSFFLMLSGLNGLHQAIVNSSAEAVMKNVLVVESRNGQPVQLDKRYHWRKMMPYDGHLAGDLAVVSYTLPSDTSHIRLSSGKLPEKAHEVLISYALDEALHHPRVLTYEMAGSYRLYVTGVVASDFFMNRQLFFTEAFVKAHQAYLSDVCVEVESTDVAHDMAALAQHYDVSSDVRMAQESYQHVLEAGKVTAFTFLAVGGISSLFLMVIVFSAIYQERQHSYALLMSLGASPGNLMTLTMREAQLVSTIIVLISLGVFSLTYQTIMMMTPWIQRYHFRLIVPQLLFPYDTLVFLGMIYVLLVTLISLMPFYGITKLSLVALLREDD